MRREEFLEKLAYLLQDISVEERREAMQYYNDYFDDAGEENEEQIVKQLGSPEKVAAQVKAGLHETDAQAGEYSEKGYTDNRFEHTELPANRENAEKKKPWTSKPLKIVLIILIVLSALPIFVPTAIGILAAIVGIIFAGIALSAVLVVVSFAVGVVGIIMTIIGIVIMFGNLAAGFLLTGTGLVLMVLGMVATVASVKLCAIVYPGIIKGIVRLGEKLVPNKKAVM